MKNEKKVSEKKKMELAASMLHQSSQKQWDEDNRKIGELCAKSRDFSLLCICNARSHEKREAQGYKFGRNVIFMKDVPWKNMEGAWDIVMVGWQIPHLTETLAQRQNFAEASVVLVGWRLGRDRDWGQMCDHRQFCPDVCEQSLPFQARPPQGGALQNFDDDGPD